MATTTAHDVIPTHVTSVVRAERLGERYVRVTFGGGLERFRPVGPDQFVYVLVPPPGCDVLAVDTGFRWSDHERIPAPVRPVGAYYTVRAHRPEAGELDVDVHLHEPAGHGSTWAAGARAGDRAALWGPRTAWAPPDGTTRWLLVADESGLPAVEAVLDALPAAADVTALVEVGDPAGVAHVDRPEVTWVEPGALAAAVRRLALDPAGLYAWGGAESGVMAQVRRHLRDVLGLAQEQVSMTAYWRRSSAAAIGR